MRIRLIWMNFAAVGLAVLAACCSAWDSDNVGLPHPDSGLDVQGDGPVDAADAADTSAEAEDVGADSALPDVQAPAGWHRWPSTPDNCSLFVPDDLTTVEPLTWEKCPFQSEGCTRAVATWMHETGGFGFGTGLQAMDTPDGLALKYARILPEYWRELVVLVDDSPVAAWRYEGANGTCAGSPTLQWGNRTSFPIIRYNAVTSPWVLLGESVTDLMTPARTEKFGPPDATIAGTSGRSFWSDDLLVVWEEPPTFAVRDLHTGATIRPRPDGVGSQGHAMPFGNQVLWWSRDKAHGTIWLYTHLVDNVPLLQDVAISYDSIVSDGSVLVWTQATGQIADEEYENVQVWTSPIGSPVALEPRLLVDGLSGVPPSLSVGEGWVAGGFGDTDVRLFRLSDGAVRVLPAVDGLAWSNGMFGLSIAGGDVWVITHQWPGSNTVPYITRFAIASLAEP